MAQTPEQKAALDALARQLVGEDDTETIQQEKPKKVTQNQVSKKIGL